MFFIFLFVSPVYVIMLLNYLFDQYDSDTRGNIYQSRKIEDYWEKHKYKNLVTKIKDASGTYVRPSMINNVNGNNIVHVQTLKKKRQIDEEERNKISTTDSILHQLLYEGKEVTNAKNVQLCEHTGMTIIRDMMKCVKTITALNNITLEPFQLEAIRSLICSSGERLLGKDLCKYIPEILETCGIRDDVTKGGMMTHGENLSQILFMTFSSYSKKIVAVVAPRRNGKSKVSKIYVTANAICERGARIVLSAHRVDAVLLYKNEIMTYLKELLQSQSYKFKIHSSENEVRLEFPDNTESAIYFVPGGKDVSISFFFFLIFHKGIYVP